MSEFLDQPKQTGYYWMIGYKNCNPELAEIKLAYGGQMIAELIETGEIVTQPTFTEHFWVPVNKPSREEIDQKYEEVKSND